MQSSSTEEKTANDLNTQRQMEVLAASLRDIQNQCCARTDFDVLYHIIYQICISGCGLELYHNLGVLVTEHLKKKIFPVMLQLSREEFLTGVLREFDQHLSITQYIHDLYSYLDRTTVYAESHGNNYLLTTAQLCFDLFRRHVLDNPHVKEHLTHAMIKVVTENRHLIPADWSDFKKACEMLIGCGIHSRVFYEEVFEEPFLKETVKFFSHLGSCLVKDSTAIHFIVKINVVLKGEMDRAFLFFDEITREKLSNVLHEQLICPHVETVVNMDTGVAFMMRNNYLEQLGELYNLVSFSPNAIDALSVVLQKYIHDANENFLNQEGDFIPLQYIRSLVDLRTLLKQLIIGPFNNNAALRKVIQLSFKDATNSHPRVAEYLAQYFDHIIKLSSKETELTLTFFEGMFDVFPFINDKDVFEKYYRHYLAKRLIVKEKFADDDIEKLMAQVLRLQCGNTYVEKINYMFRDMYRSVALMDSYKKFVAKKAQQQCRLGEVKRLIDEMVMAIEMVEQMQKRTAMFIGTNSAFWFHPQTVDTTKTGSSNTNNCDSTVVAKNVVAVEDENSKENNIDIHVKVINNIHWPFTDTKDDRAKITLPSDAERSMLGYINFYVGCHNNRHLNVYHSYGTADIIAHFYVPSNDPTGFVEKKKFLVVTTHMMCILDRFNYKKTNKYEDLLRDTKLPEQMLKRALFSMTSKKSQCILVRKAASRVLGAGDYFVVNDQFPVMCKNYRVRVTNLLPKGAVERLVEDKKKKKPEAVKQDPAHWAKLDRPYEVDAAAMRIMKTRKTMTYHDLIAEITLVLTPRFVPTTAMIKRRLEELLNREFISRDEADINLYHYVA